MTRPDPTLPALLARDAAELTPAVQSADPLAAASGYRWHFLVQFRTSPRREAESRYPHPYRHARVAALRPVRLPVAA